MKKNKIILVIILIAVLLVSCGKRESFKDLRNYIASLDKQQTSVSDRKIVVKVIPKSTPSSYKKDSSRTPFDEMAVKQGQQTALRNPLSAYPLNLLRFVGTIAQNNQVWAYITTPDNKIYQLTIGDIVGDHNGTIVKISPTRIEIVEKIAEEGTKGTQRIVTLELREETSNE